MDTHRPTPRRNAGFTLIEAVIALAIVAILAGASLPNLGQMMARSQMTSAVNGFVAGFQQARMRAVTRAAQVVACPSDDGRTCRGGLDWSRGWLIFDDDNRNRRLDEGERIVTVFGPVPQGLDAASSVGRPSLVYRADGSAAGSNLRVTVCDQRGRIPGRSVVVNQGGRPRAAPDELNRCA